MKKRILAILMSLVLVSAVGCGKKDSDKKKPSDSKKPAVSSSDIVDTESGVSSEESSEESSGDDNVSDAFTYDSDSFFDADMSDDGDLYEDSGVATVTPDGKMMEVRIMQYHPGIPGYDAKYRFRVYYGEEGDLTALMSDEYTLSCNNSNIKIDGDEVVVPASFKDNATVDGIKIYATLKTDKTVKAYYPLMIKSWKQTFVDNFDGAEINRENWKLPSDLVTQISNMGGGKTFTASDDCSYVENGKLVLKIKDGHGAKTNHKTETDFVDARLESRFQQRFGCFMASISLSKANGTCAFWLMPEGVTWGLDSMFKSLITEQNCGEVDILEYSPYWGGDSFQVTEHWFDSLTGNHMGGTAKSVYVNGTELTDGSYNNIATVWTENALYTYFNGELVKTTHGLSADEKKAYMILSYHTPGYGNEPSWTGSITEADLDKTVYYYDYVKVFQ